ncbi:unnamed protein product [Rotaria socialis]|uniref:RNA helicase n=1 Tax=Rotaria socialis TaxID=392032 RepID=A0A821H9K0_9BILA|nr:unnamed protein product [Rotaria socialis]CAF4454287.1 unnamed protein product [Rotaria socialis]CAF4677283.1 unnamed protein product [Rotaria socialis]CAF4824911.1 unnamed protein product [Rotaria socialis]
MSNLEEKLNILKKKKLTAKTIVEQQRNEIRLLKSTLTINERLEDIYKRFDNKQNIDKHLYNKILQKPNDKHEKCSLIEQIHRSIEDLSNLIEQILTILSINNNIDLKNQEFNCVLKKQKECFQLIKWKLSDIYASRIADEVSYRMDFSNSDKLCFEQLNLPSGLLFGLYAMGFENGPSNTQALILPHSLSDQSQRNMIVQSKTGTGKTVSYMIHILARIQYGLSQPQVLIIVPTIELAFTVGSGIEKMSAYLPNLPITYVTFAQLIETPFDTPIVIGTIDTFDSFQSLINFSQLEMLIVDEIDTMIIRDDYRQSLLNLFDSVPITNHCQILVYSSTLSEQILNFTKELIPNSILIKQRSDKQHLLNVEQFYVTCDDETDKDLIVNTILRQFMTEQIMIFCFDDQTTERLYQQIKNDMKKQYVLEINRSVQKFILEMCWVWLLVINPQMPLHIFLFVLSTRILTTKFNDQHRVSLIEEFRTNSFRIFLLSAQTSATTHGIDLDNVSIVINYDLPCSLGIHCDLDYVTYHQRLDRCGRYDKHGYLFNLIQTLEDCNIQLGQQNYFSFSIKQIDSDGIQKLVL